MLLLSLIGLWKMWFLHAKSVQNLRKCHPFAHLCVNHEPPQRLHIGQREERGPPETQRFKAPAMHTGAETHLASQTREHTPCTQTIDGLYYSTQCFYVAGWFIFVIWLLGYFSFGKYFTTFHWFCFLLLSWNKKAI